MLTLLLAPLRSHWLWALLILLSLPGCRTAYHFQYDYTMISPPGGSVGIEDEQVRIQLTPAPAAGVMQLTVTNKSAHPIAIVWAQTQYIDPFGHRKPVTETGMQWFFRPREWFTDDTRLAPGQTRHLRLHPGGRQTYNPFTISRAAEGNIRLSTSPPPLFPTSGNTPTLGKRYQGREFRLLLALRIDSRIIQYPFTFRITGVDVQ